MRVVPGRAVQLGAELIREAPARRDGALRDAGDAVLPRAPRLEEAVPVYRRALVLGLVLDVVVDADLDVLAPVGLDQGARELTVDEDDALLVPVGRYHAAADVEVVPPHDLGHRRLRVRVARARLLVAPGDREGTPVAAAVHPLRKLWGVERPPCGFSVGSRGFVNQLRLTSIVLGTMG